MPPIRLVTLANMTAVVSNKSVDLNLSSFDTTYREWVNLEMMLQISWETDYATGNSSSGIFAVASDEYWRDMLYNNITKDIKLDGNNYGKDNIDDPSSTSSTAATSSSSALKESGGGGGLSKGAIAGIVVGAVVGVLLILGLVAWFCLRRRRQSKRLQAGASNDQQASNAYMVDKEITRAHVTDSPHSTPYSDEGQVQPVPLNDLHTARDVQHHGDDDGGDGGRGAAYSPFQDRPEAAARVPTGGSQATQGPTNVAHLIEDGMTDDQIRRLEEEERQLDDEIERAGRR